LSETPRAAPTQSAKQPTNQTNKNRKKKIVGQRLGRRGIEEVGHKRRKMVKEKGVKHRTKVKEYQVNCLVQRVEDKGRRGGSEGHPSSHLSILDFNVGFFFFFFLWCLDFGESTHNHL
jgi:hypothetical protein